MFKDSYGGEELDSIMKFIRLFLYGKSQVKFIYVCTRKEYIFTR